MSDEIYEKPKFEEIKRPEFVLIPQGEPRTTEKVWLIPISSGEQAIPHGWEFGGLFDRAYNETLYQNNSSFPVSRHEASMYLIKKPRISEYESENQRITETYNVLIREFENSQREFKKYIKENENLISELKKELEDKYESIKYLREKEKNASQSAKLRETDLFKLRDFLGSKQFNEILGVEK